MFPRRSRRDDVNFVVSELEGMPVAAQPVEIVERKGLGHPDTLCDVLAEEVSLALSRFYRERFGFVLHHNVDKVLLRGGAARPAFAGGEVNEPIELYLAGRATREYRGVEIPVDHLAIAACRSWLSTNMHALDAERHVRVHCLVRPGSMELVELFERQRRAGALRLANDTAMGVGFAPLTPLEGAVLMAERSLQERAAPERGEDVKVMGVRVGAQSTLTVACAFVGGHLRDLDAYLAARSRAAERVRAATTAILNAEPTVEVNTADDPAAGSVYLTVTGTSAEAGDDGQTGRGNRANGLITPARPMAIESFAGKTPITHVGKLYNVAATRLAEALVSEIEGAREAHVLLVSRIGAPIEEPQVVHVRLRAETPGQVAELTPRATEITRHHLAEIGSLWELLLQRNLASVQTTMDGRSRASE
ncbi:MAG: S-adenosylmethionine synthase [Candidatus Muproteobacteria bacterium RBG_16_64_11]|uniref:S-adenosylmethionine synthase n=1 Tax=Candidatus Muproteobacteria bacterium RBG_16_64_11 TaxID=1817758 RepID=A0A1F6TBL4_9PROT|nr:MAG: S-adenosylmethionine synthase [Candidatus Muproteobacteria bacterium RBG_16_64_11]